MSEPILSGPAFEPVETELYVAQKCHTCGDQKRGLHYNQYQIAKNGTVANLRVLFPNGEADDLNFVLFSTSGVHGSYTSIDSIEKSLLAYGEDFTAPEEEQYPDDYCLPVLTVLVVHPRVVCLRYGNITVTLADIPYLKKLRASSWEAVKSIGGGQSE